MDDALASFLAVTECADIDLAQALLQVWGARARDE
jgi:hypothetical protein